MGRRRCCWNTALECCSGNSAHGLLLHVCSHVSAVDLCWVVHSLFVDLDRQAAAQDMCRHLQPNSVRTSVLSLVEPVANGCLFD